MAVCGICSIHNFINSIRNLEQKIYFKVRIFALVKILNRYNYVIKKRLLTLTNYQPFPFAVS